MTNNVERKKGMKYYLSILGLLIVTVIWGGGFVASDIALNTMTPFQIMTIRFFFGAVLMSLIDVKALKEMKKHELKAGFFMGLALFIGFAFQTVGLMYTTPSKNAFLTALNVVIVPFIAAIFLKKKIDKRGMIGAVMAVVGVGLLSLNADFTLGAGDILTIICAVGFAFQIFLTGVFVKSCNGAVLNAVQMSTAFLLSLISMLCLGQGKIAITPSGVWSVLYLGLVSTTLCFFLQTLCQKWVEETKAAIILSMESVFGTIFSILILHEVLTVRMIIGCAIILGGVVLSSIEDTVDNVELGLEV